MNTIAQSRPLTDAVLAMLEQVIGDGVATRASKVVGDHQAPKPPEGMDQPEYPYMALYRITQMVTGAPLDESSSDTQAIYQLTSVGRTRAQAEAMADAGRRAFLDHDGAAYVNDISPEDSQVVIRRELLSAEDPSWVGTVCSVSERYRLDMTPG